MIKKNNHLHYKFIGLFLILIILFFLSYRDFLITMKLMLFHFYNFPMLPLDPYYKMILLFDGENVKIGDHQIKDGWLWQYLRIVPLIINWIIFKIIPCFKMASIPEFIDNKTYCSIWSISIVNYTSGLLIQLGFFLLIRYKFRRSLGESILILFTSYFVLNFLDKYGIDKISFLYLVIFFLLEKKQKLIYLLIILSVFVNEKCTLLLCSYFLLIEFDFKNILKSIYKSFLNINFLLSFLLCLGYLYLTYVKIDDYFSKDIVDYNYLTLHALTNSIIPLILLVIPFLVYFFHKNVLVIFNLKQNFILILIIFLLLGLFVGGTGNMGRYLVYTSIIFLPITNFLIYKILSNLDYFLLYPKYSNIDIIKMFTKH